MTNNTAMVFWAKRALAAVLCALIACFGAVGCAAEDSAQEEQPKAQVQQEESKPQEKPAAKKKGMDFEYSQQDLDPLYDESLAVIVDLTGEEAFAQDDSVLVEGTAVTVKDAGVYLFSGMLSNGQIVVDAPEGADVQLVLNNVAIHNEDGPAIYVKQAGKCFVTLPEGSDNSLTDGPNYVLEEGAEEPFATIFSACDFVLNGSGALSVTSAYQDAVYSDGALTVTGGTYSVVAAQNGLVGKSCVKVCGGSVAVESQADAIKSTSQAAYQGFVSLDGGSFSLSAVDDAVQAFRLVRIMDGAGSIQASDDAVHSDRKVLLAGGKFSIKAADDAVHAGTVLTMDGGSVDVSSCFEGYEAEKIYINGGSVNITAADDAVNAESAKAHEPAAEEAEEFQGEAQEPQEAPADSEAVDGSSGPEEESFNESVAFGKAQTGMAEGESGLGDQNCLIRINDGTVVLNAGGDGLDSNGKVVIAGGTVLISGPGNSGNAAMDYDLSARITGGTFIATGMEGMAQNFTGGTQPFAFVKTSGQPGSNVALVDSEGAVIASFTPTSAFNTVMVSSPDFQEEGEYSLVIGGIVERSNDSGEGAGSKVSGGNTVAFTASTTPEGGMGGLESSGLGASAGKAGSVQIPKRK